MPRKFKDALKIETIDRIEKLSPHAQLAYAKERLKQDPNNKALRAQFSDTFLKLHDRKK